MRLLLLLGLLTVVAQAQAQVDQNTINVRELPEIWRCKPSDTKGTNQTLTIRGLPSDFNPLLYVEGYGVNSFINPMDTIEKWSVWTAQGGVHLCFKGGKVDKQSFYYLNLVESFLNPNKKEKVKSDLSQWMYPTQMNSCKDINNSMKEPVDNVDWLECSYVYNGTGVPTYDYNYNGPMTPDPAIKPVGVKENDLSGMNSVREILRVRSGSSNPYVLVRGNSGQLQVGGLGKVYSDAHIAWLLDDEKLSNVLIAAAGLKNANNGVSVLFSDFLLSDDQNSIYLAGYMIDKHVNDKKSESWSSKDFVVKLDESMNPVANFGAKGIAFIGGKNNWNKISSDQTSGPKVQWLKDGRIAMMTHISAKKDSSEQPVRLTILRADGNEDAKFRDAFNKNTAVTSALDKVDKFEIFEANGDDILLVIGNSVSDRVFVKVNVAGVFDSNFFNSLRETPGKNCQLSSATHSRNGGWLFFQGCYGAAVIKVSDSGQLDASFGANGYADIAQWQQQSNLGFQIKSLGYGYQHATELQDGRLVIPFEYKGTFSKRQQSGFMLVDKRGYLDRSFAMNGVFGGSITPFNLSMSSQHFAYVDGRIPIGIGLGGNGANITVRRYLP